MAQTYRLKISHVEQTCLFELSWGKGQQLTAQLPYSPELETLYQTWQRLYLCHSQSALRGRHVFSGQLSPPQDWQAQLVQAEAALLTAFHKWLRREPLFEIRKVLGRSDEGPEPSSLLIACDLADLGRLPWESWEIGAEFGARRSVRIARLPVNVQQPSPPRPSQARHGYW